jgi:signal transduction histidine kinase
VAFDEFDYQRPVLQTTSIPLASSVRALVDEVTATAADLSVTVQGSESAMIVANRRLFERAVTNLLLNAMSYGEGKIAVWVREHEQHCVVDVQDNGPGIPERDRLQVIKPFVRLGKKKTRGTGLGLAIVTRIMALHEGRLHIVDAPGGGASMQLVWKNARPRPLRRWQLLLGPRRAAAGGVKEGVEAGKGDLRAG